MTHNISNESSKAIDTLLAQFQSSWNEKDASKMASYFTSDAEFTDIMGQVAQGKEKIEAMHQFVFSKFMRDAVLEQETLYMREIAPNTVLCTLKWRTTGHTNPANQPLPPRSGLMQVIVSELDQQWAITLVHNLDFTHLYNNIEDYTMQPFGPR